MSGSGERRGIVFYLRVAIKSCFWQGQMPGGVWQIDDLKRQFVKGKQGVKKAWGVGGKALLLAGANAQGTFVG